jgi:hypothetical protein
MQHVRRSSKLVIAFIILGVIYLAQVFTISANDSGLKRFHISTTKATVLSLAVVIPYLIIWAIALIGYLKFRRYVRRIRPSRDGQAMFVVMCGLFWLLLWLPINSIVGNLTNHLSDTHHAWASNLYRANLFVSLGILFVAFLLLYIGSMRIMALKEEWHLDAKALLWRQVFYTTYACFSALYIFAVFAANRHSSQPVSLYFSDAVLLLAIMVPRLIMWFFGVHAVWNIRSFSRNTVAPIYREAFKYVAAGVGLITLCLVTIGILTTSNGLSHYNLGIILVIVYAILVVMAAGWLVLGRGAGKLERIEQA